MFDAIRQQFSELIKKTKFDYYLLWEGERRYLVCLKIGVDGNKILQKEIFQLDGAGADENQSITSVLKKAKYMKDEVTVLLSGPDVFQKITVIKSAEHNIEEELINLRESLWPKGVADHELMFDYRVLYHQDQGTVLFIAFVKKTTLDKIKTYCEEKGIVPGKVSSNLSILLASKENRLKDYMSNGILLRANSIVEELEWQSESTAIIKSGKIDDNVLFYKDNEEQPSEMNVQRIEDILCSYSISGYNQEILAFDDYGNSIKTAIYDFCYDHFRKAISLLLSVFVLLAAFNIYLSIMETSNSQALQEYQFKEAGIERLNQEYARLKDKSARYSYIMGKKLKISGILCDFGKLKPEKMWLRRLNFTNIGKANSQIRLNGLSYGDKEILDYYKTLSEVREFSDIKLGDLSQVPSGEAGKIPARYRQDLFTFSLEMGTAK